MAVEVCRSRVRGSVWQSYSLGSCTRMVYARRMGVAAAAVDSMVVAGLDSYPQGRRQRLSAAQSYSAVLATSIRVDWLV